MPMLAYTSDSAAANEVATSATIKSFVTTQLPNEKLQIKAFYNSHPSAPYQSVVGEDKDQNFYASVFDVDLKLALGHAPVAQGTVITASLQKQGTQICVVKVKITGEVYDLYDFDYMSNDQLIHMGAVAQFCQGAGDYMGGGIFWDVIKVDQDVPIDAMCFE